MSVRSRVVCNALPDVCFLETMHSENVLFSAKIVVIETLTWVELRNKMLFSMTLPMYKLCQKFVHGQSDIENAYFGKKRKEEENDSRTFKTMPGWFFGDGSSSYIE